MTTQGINLNHLKLRARTTKTSVAMALLGELADAAQYFGESVRPYRFVRGTKRYQAFYSLRSQRLLRARRIGNKLEITSKKN